MFELNLLGWLTVSISSVLIGIGKTGVPGAVILAVPLMAAVLPSRASVGVLLPMLIFADIFAAIYYRHEAQWRDLVRLIPWTLVGIYLGYIGLDSQ